MLGELRTVAVTGAEIGTLPGRRHLYARHLVNALDDEARRNLWRLARMALSGDRGSLFLELSAVSPGLPDRVDPAGLGRRVDADGVVAELEAYGACVEERRDGPGTDVLDRPDPWTCRLQVRFPRPPGATRA